MMNRTECDVNVARHARRIEYSNQTGWLHDTAAPKQTRPETGRLTQLAAWARTTRRRTRIATTA